MRFATFLTTLESSTIMHRFIFHPLNGTVADRDRTAGNGLT
jgi:hypothetical protein